MKIFKITSAILLAIAALVPARAQQSVVLPPLFEYPTAPEDLPDLESKSNYIITNFWRSFDFNQKNTVGQAQLNHAFKVFATPMQWATPSIVYATVDDLLKKLKKNPSLLYQFTAAAEDNLYGHRAEMWIDDIYLRFVDELLKNKKVKQIHKVRFEAQKATLVNSLRGKKLGKIEFTTPTGEKKTFEPASELTILELGSPTCADCRMAKLKFDTDSDIERLMKEGRLNICFIIPDGASEENWEEMLADYPENWTVGAGEDLDLHFDTRLVPSIYLIDKDGIILNKNVTPDEAVNFAINYLK